MSDARRPRSARAAAVPDAVLDAVVSSPWAITEAGLHRVLAVASRLTISPEALQERAGEPLDNTHTVTVRDGVATIPLRGVMAQRGGMFSAISGATSYSTVARDLHAALEDPAVSAILLSIDSPGGEVAGCHELWAQLLAARGTKPIEAYIGGDGASAAYWLACAADRVHASETAVVGCLGVRMSAVDDTRAMRRAGYERIEIVSSQTPAKAMDPTIPEGRVRVQRMVDDLATVFLASVATARGVSVDTVRAEYGGGDVFVGRAALERGLIDALGTEESVHAALVARAAAAKAQPPAPTIAVPAVRALDARAAVTPRVSPIGPRTTSQEPAMARNTRRPTGRNRRARVRAAFNSGDEVTIAVTRTIGVSAGDIGVIEEVREGRFYAVSVGDGDDMYAYLAEDELEIAAGEAPAEGDEPAATEDEDEETTAEGESPDEDEEESAEYDDEEDKPAARRGTRVSRTARQVVTKLRAAAAKAERSRILGILAYEGKAASSVLRACIEDPKCSPAIAAQRILEAGSAGGSNRLRALRGDERSVAATGLTAQAPSAGTTTKLSGLAARVSAGYQRKRGRSVA